MRIECPCCKGERVVFAFEQGRDGLPQEPSKHDCCHCQGEGEIDAGTMSTTSRSVTDIQFPANLQRCELTKSAKRDHLLDLETSSDDIEEILASLYP